MLTSTGALLWPLLDGRTTVGELAADVADVFGVEPAVADDDVRRFVEEMTGRGLSVARTAETERIVDVDGAGRRPAASVNATPGASAADGPAGS